MQITDCVVGKEYEYLGQFVKLLEYRQIPGNTGSVECLVQTRFFQMLTVDLSELSLKSRG